MEKIKGFICRNWVIILLTITGAILRFYRLESSLQFLGDQGRDALIMKRLLIDHDFPFIGPITSVGNFYLGPLYYYLMAPFLWLFNFNPVGPAFATALIGTGTIPAIYYVTLKMFSSRPALIAAFLYAFGSIPVLQTRGAWNPNPMPLVSLGIIFSLYHLIIKKQYQWLVVFTFCLASALQLHYIILFLFPFLLWQFIRLPQKSKLTRYLWLSLAIFLVFNLPLILFEAKNNFVNLKGLLYYFQSSGYQQFNWWQKLKDINGRSEEVIGMVLGFGERFSIMRAWVSRIILFGIAILLFKQPSRAAILLVQYLFFSILALVFYQGSIFPHYLGFLYPVVYILAALLLSKFRGKYWLFAGLFILFFLKINLSSIKNVLVNNHGNLKSSAITAEHIAQDIDLHHYSDFNLILIDDTHDYRAMGFRYFLELKGKKALGIDNYSQAKIVYVISPYPQVDVTNIPVWEIKSTWPSRETEKWEFTNSENIYKIEAI